MQQKGQEKGKSEGGKVNPSNKNKSQAEGVEAPMSKMATRKSLRIIAGELKKKESKGGGVEKG